MIPLGILAASGAPGVEPDSPFPEVRGVSSYRGIAQNVHLIDLPSADPGDLLILQTSSVGTSTLTLPAGWTQLANVRPNTTARGVWAYRIAEPGDPVTASITQSGVVRMSAIVVAIGGGTYEGLPEIATASGTSSDDRYSPELTPSWGVGSNLWLAMLSTNGDAAVNQWPYPSGRSASINIGGSCLVCTRELNAAKEEPGSWVMAANYSWAAATIAVKGA